MKSIPKNGESLTVLRWSGLPQFIGHQIGWWACVLLMGWIGPLVMLLFVGLHFYMTRLEWRGEAVVALVSVLVGIAVDNTLHLFGAVSYVGELTVGWSPLWLVAIWLGFGVTLRHCQSIFVRKLPNAFFVGVLGGPLAYLGGVKLERLTVEGPQSWISVSIVWTIAMLILFYTVRQVDRAYAKKDPHVGLTA